jgi:hypothetical protein
MNSLGAIYEQASVKWGAGRARDFPTIYSASPACGAPHNLLRVGPIHWHGIPGLKGLLPWHHHGVRLGIPPARLTKRHGTCLAEPSPFLVQFIEIHFLR